STRSRRPPPARRKSAKPTNAPQSSAASATSLRRIIRLRLLLLARRALALRRRVADRLQAALQVVEDEADGRLWTGRRDDRPSAFPEDEDAALMRRRFELRRLAGSRALPLVEQAAASFGELLVAAARSENRALFIDDDGRADLRRDLGEV